MERITIFGEAHFEPSSVASIQEQIRKLKPTVIVHEMLGSGMYTVEEAKKALANAGHPDSPCDPELNIDVFRLGVELNAKLFGCDLSDKNKEEIKTRGLGYQFSRREGRMLEVIHGIADKRNMVVVVGDIHLRRTWNRTIGPSAITTSWEKGRLDATIIRAPEEFQEIK